MSSPGFVPASPNTEAQSKNDRGGRDKPGYDRGERPRSAGYAFDKRFSAENLSRKPSRLRTPGPAAEM
jgi:hypothetical protein